MDARPGSPGKCSRATSSAAAVRPSTRGTAGVLTRPPPPVGHRGAGDEPASDTRKVWWAQAEWIAALTDGLRDKPGHAPYVQALLRVLAFMRDHATDARTGIWLDTVSADGTPRSSGLAHSWKTLYHDTRGLLKFVEAFQKA